MASRGREGGWVVHKFGGTSVASAERYQNALKILRGIAAQEKTDQKTAIVVSAMSGVTDALIRLVDLARSRQEAYLNELDRLVDQHLGTIKELLSAGRRTPLDEIIRADAEDIREVLRGVYLARFSSERVTELIAGYGEVWSAQIMNALLQSEEMDSAWLDARKVLTVEPLETSVHIDWNRSSSQWSDWEKAHPRQNWIVITGFIASTPEGIATTLKRNGSDYSASIFGSLLKAQSIVIWTDVDGVLSADPKLVPEAVPLSELSYQEATELAYFGAKVVHPSTMAPAIEQKIPIWIRNTFNPSHPGTKIHSGTPLSSTEPQKEVKGFATVQQMALVNLEGTGMVGVPGIAQRLFGALREVGVSVVLISQASSEHSICFAVPDVQSKLVKETVEKAFMAELQDKRIQSVTVIPGCSILAAVGDAMAHTPGVSGRFFRALGHAGVNILAIAQGSSERNISAVISGADSKKALRAAHAAFFLSRQTLSIGVVGLGNIGATFLKQLAVESSRLKGDFNIDLRIRGICNSKKMLLSDPPLDLQNWEATLNEKGAPLNLEEFARHVRAEHLPHSVLIDCTASDDIPACYAGWLKSGLHLITPNKKANTQSIESYRELRKIASRGSRHFLYETNVGAGLPIISTLRDLVQTGDRVNRIEGVFSGTLSFLLNQFDGETEFSQIVLEAKSLGLTEPDPKEDLSGMDVARKMVILGREMGFLIELKNVQVESLVPYSDLEMKKRFKDAAARDEVLRYVGGISEQGVATVGLKTFPKTHFFARTQLTDNIVAFTTRRYLKQPLIVQGPGAGPEVTAAGVFADLLRLASYLGGP